MHLKDSCRSQVLTTYVHTPASFMESEQEEDFRVGWDDYENDAEVADGNQEPEDVPDDEDFLLQDAEGSESEEGLGPSDLSKSSVFDRYQTSELLRT